MLRERQKRNLLTTLFLSQGVPMVLGGDEIGRTQGGNNNGYAQDNEVSWFDWSEDLENAALLEFTRKLSRFRRQHPVFRRRRFFQGRPIYGTDVSDIVWLKPDGQMMSHDDWAEGWAKSITVFLNGEAIPTPDPRGEPVVDDSFLVLFNANADAMPFTLPDGGFGESWDVAIDTNEPMLDEGDRTAKAGSDVEVEGRSVVVLRRAY